MRARTVRRSMSPHGSAIKPLSRIVSIISQIRSQKTISAQATLHRLVLLVIAVFMLMYLGLAIIRDYVPLLNEANIAGRLRATIAPEPKLSTGGGRPLLHCHYY